jgi:hypothetical protein
VQRRRAGACIFRVGGLERHAAVSEGGTGSEAPGRGRDQRSDDGGDGDGQHNSARNV